MMSILKAVLSLSKTMKSKLSFIDVRIYLLSCMLQFMHDVLLAHTSRLDEDLSTCILLSIYVI